MYSSTPSAEGLLNHFAQYQMHAATSGGAGIDWATLAQQWIQMRDCMSSAPASAPASTPQTLINPNVNYPYSEVAPLPPIISNNHAINPNIKINEIKKIEEKGEADMDMDDDEDSLALNSKNESTSPPAPPIMSIDSNWYTTNSSLPVNVVEIDKAASTNSGSWSNWQGANKPSSQASARVGSSTSHIPSLLNLNVANPNEINDPSGLRQNNDLPNSGVDAAKRKILPAWIREGLEKMEREKQKQLEREKQHHEERKGNRWDSDGEDEIHSAEQNILLSKNMVNNLSNIKEEVLYSSGNEEDIQATSTKKKRNNLKADTAEESDPDENTQQTENISKTTKPYKRPCKTFEEKLNDLMIAVRRNLTELLLEVTDKEIASVVHESVRAQRMKASSAQVIRKSAISSITGKLGLAAYADSSDSENDSNDDSDNEKRSTNYDSEEDLKQTIRAKRRAFVKIADDIERRVALAAEKEEEKLQYYKDLEKEKEKKKSNGNEKKSKNDFDKGHEKTNSSMSKYGKFGKTFNKDFGEASVSKIHHLNGGKHHSSSRKERTTRFTDNKDSKSVTAAAAAAVVAATTFSSNKASQRPQPIPNPATALLQMPPMASNDIELLNQLSNSKNSDGIKDMLDAAEEAIEKASKRKSSSSKKRRRSYSSDEDKRRNRRKRERSESSSSSSSSSESNDSSETESSKRSSKHSRSSTETKKDRPKDRLKSRDRHTSRDRHDSRSSSRYYDHKRDYTSNSSSKNHDRYKDNYYYSKSSSKTRRYSSDSDNHDKHGDDFYRKSKSSNSYKHSSSKSSSKRYRSRTRSRSRSRSRSHSHSTKLKSRSRSRSHSYSSSKHRSKR